MSTTIEHLWAHIQQNSGLHGHERFKHACGVLLLSMGIQRAALTAVRERRQASPLHIGTFFVYNEYAATFDEWPTDGMEFFDSELDALNHFAHHLTAISQATV